MRRGKYEMRRKTSQCNNNKKETAGKEHQIKW
jgi:hypothetical protein